MRLDNARIGGCAGQELSRHEPVQYSYGTLAYSGEKQRFKNLIHCYAYDRSIRSTVSLCWKSSLQKPLPL